MTLTVEMNWVGVTSNVASGVISQTKTQLIVVDASLPRLDILLADLAPEKSVLRIEPYQDAVACISEALTHSPAQSLVIVAHGRPGEVHLGRDLLTGGGGSDIFVLQRYGGKDIITDFDLSTDKLGLGRRLGMSQLHFSGEKVLFRGRAMAKPLQRRIAILEGVDTFLLTVNNFESV